MSVLRWVLSYSGVIIVLIAVALGYVYREEIAAWFDASERQLVGAEADAEEAAAEKVPEAAPTEPAIASSEPAEPSEAAPAPATGEPTETPDEAAGAEQADTGEAGSPAIAESRSFLPPTGTPASPGTQPSPGAYGKEAAPQPAPGPYATPPSRALPGAAERPSAPMPGYYPPRPPAEAQRAPAPEMLPAMPAEAQPEPLADADREALLDARRTFWEGGAEPALEPYQALAKKLAEHPDVQGELGNLQLMLRRRDEAVQSYSRAAELLQANQRPRQALTTAQIVARLDPQRGFELLQRLREQSNAKR
jgi:hypothetical protein